MRERWKKLQQTLTSFFKKLRKPKGIATLSGFRTPPKLPSIDTLKNLKGKTLSLSAVDWEKIYRKSFLYNSVVTIICAYFVADFLALAFSPWYPEPIPPRARISLQTEKKDISRYNEIYARNLFNKDGLIPDADDTGAGFDGPPVRTSLPLSLLGVIVLNDEAKSVASVENKSSNQVVAVRINESISPVAIVQKIESNKVIFINKNTERREYIELPKDQITARRAAVAKPGAKSGGITNAGNNRYAIDRAEVDKALGNLNEIVTQARCVPNFEGGRPSGYRCFQIIPGSIYDKLGMKDNDVICGINGQPVNDPGVAFQQLSELKTAKEIQICINRNGRVMNMVYEFN